jgi:oligopeptide/dipeptide ABC transporter ATP-binding protein
VRSGELAFVRDVSFDVDAGERVGLIGESGSGKSLTALAVMGLLGEGLTATGRVGLAGEDLVAASERRRCELRGDKIAMIFQEPMTALNPTMRVGAQVGEALRIHRRISRRAATAAAVELLARVELPEPARAAGRFPHELSGGQRQRVMMAIAISCDPDVILADEPTTALDVTVQRRVLDLLDRLVAEEGCALLLITHDLAVVSELCDRVLTMYGGRLVESGSTPDMLGRPRHPYTRALLNTSMAVSVDGAAPGTDLPSIPGSVPSAGSFPAGCPFRVRCDRHLDACVEMPAMTSAGDHSVACWNPVAWTTVVGNPVP